VKKTRGHFLSILSFSSFCMMEYDLARARNVDAAPVEMYRTARTRSFLPPPAHGTAFFSYVGSYLTYLLEWVPGTGTSYRTIVRSLTSQLGSHASNRSHVG
jgi:hypothetical protein